jgi:guanylate kinase
LFVESVEILGDLYGSTIKSVHDIALTGKICVLAIDVQVFFFFSSEVVPK